MKIYYILSARMPTEKAHGFQIAKTCEAFSGAGVDLELWVPTRKTSIKNDFFKYYKIKKNFKIRYFNCFDFSPYRKYLGFFTDILNNYIFSFKTIFIKKDSGGIIYTRSQSVVMAYLLSKRKIILERHEWFNWKKIITLSFICRANKVIATNNFIKDKFKKYFFSENKLLVAPNGVDLKVFDLNLDKKVAIKNLDLENDVRNKLLHSTVLLYTGSFTTKGQKKGIDEILEAIKILNDNKLFFIAIGGSQKEVDYYKKISQKLVLENKALFKARTTQKKLAFYQKASDILLMPFPDIAHYRYYMAPMKTFEYSVSRRPIIASNLPSIKEILNDNTAVFCQPSNSKDLSEKIKYIIDNTEIAKDLANKAYEESKKYTWEKRAEKILEFIKK